MPILEELADYTGILAAEIDGVLVGAVVTSTGSWVRGGPALSTLQVATRVFGPGTLFLYGPVVVEQAFRRRGILRALFDHVSRELSATFGYGVAFVELSNDASLAAHQRLGLEPIGDFEFDAQLPGDGVRHREAGDIDRDPSRARHQIGGAAVCRNART